MVGGARVVIAGVVLLSSLAVVEPLGASMGPQVPGSPVQVPVEAGDSEPAPVEVVPGVPVVLPPGREEMAPSPDDGPIVSPADVGVKRDARVVAVSELVDVVVDGRAQVGTSPVTVEFVSVAPAAISVEERSAFPESDDATVAESASGTSTTSVEEVAETTLAAPINLGGGSSIDDSVSAGGDATVDEFDVAAASTSSTTVPVESTVDELVAGSPSGDVDVSQPGQIRVDVVGEEMAASAGLEKVAFTVEPVDGAFVRGDRARVTIDYSGFRDAFGADWAGRLQVVSFGSCWLTATARKGCAAPVPLTDVDNDVVAGTISFEADFAAVEDEVAARTTVASGEDGDCQKFCVSGVV